MMDDMLPQPSGAFDWVQASAGPALVCRPLDAVARHLFTSRSWPLGLATGERGWEDVARAMDVTAGALVRLRQVHGAAVVTRRLDDLQRPPQAERSSPPVRNALDPSSPPDSPGPVRSEADIVISNDPRDLLAIQTADCVPLLVADPRTGAAAAAHAGWRGLAARVPGITIQALARAFGSRPGDLIAAAGPSIGACCYEVGEEVRARFVDAQFEETELARWFGREPRPTPRNPTTISRRSASGAGTDRWYFDGWRATRDQLVSAGVGEARIYVAELCTAGHEQAFCSYRRDGAACGRMAAAIRCGPLRPWPRLPADPRAR
jgi:YfiH family protein